MTGQVIPSKILLVGAGKMGTALLKGWLERGAVSPADVTVVEPLPSPVLDALCKQGVTLVSDAANVGGAGFGLVVLAVKPQILSQVLKTLPGGFPREAVFVSIAAGQSLRSLEAGLGADRAIARVMPNLPATIGRGVSVYCGNGKVERAQKDLIAALLSAVGSVHEIKDEGLMDAVTAVSGSGPAYVFLLVEAMARAGESCGLPRELSLSLARDTVAGAAELAAESPDSPESLRQAVTSPGGTTEAALNVLRDKDLFYSLFEKALAAATQRGRDLNS